MSEHRQTSPPRKTRPTTVAFAILTFPPVALSALYLYEVVYRQWAVPYHWVNGLWHIHSPASFFTLAAMGLLWLLSLVAGVGLARAVFRQRRLPGLLTAWFLVSAASLASFYPSDRAYAAAAVALWGPGKNIKRLLQDAAVGDSTLIIDAMNLHGEKIDHSYLAFAAGSGGLRFVKRLVSMGAPVNERDFTSLLTPLANAVQFRRYAVAEFLIEAGARSDIPDRRGLTALDHAWRQGDQRMISILEKR